MLQRSPHTVSVKSSPSRKHEPRATIDFEGRSACDIKRGAWLYSRHETTEILCLSYLLPGMKKPKLWHRAHPALGIKETSPRKLQKLFAWIKRGGLIEAHNAEFEIDMWENIGVPVHGWPSIADDQWRCSAAKAAAHALPRALGAAVDALGLSEKKDKIGDSLIRKYSKPKRLTKAEREQYGDDAIIWNEDVPGLKAMWRYNKQDVVAEHGLSEALDDLSPKEERLWRITRKMNRRGVLIDTELASAALALAAKAKAKANAELESLTGISAGTQRKKVKDWLADNELVDLPDTRAKTLEWFIEREDMSDRARRVITIMKEVSRTSTNKFKRMLECVDEDGRARELLLFCGAERTGRFSGRGIQIHNLPKGKFAKYLPKKTAIDIACADVKSRNLAWCELIHGDVMNLIVSCLRGAIIAPPGRELLAADYSSIEARCVLWESGAVKALEVFTNGGDIYCDMASGIYGREITKETAKPINAMGATERDFGKVAVLGLGYGMGYLKFLITLRTYNIVLTRAEVLNMIGAKRLKFYEAKVRRRLFPQPSDYTGRKDADRLYKRAEREAALNRRILADEREDARAVMHELALCLYTVKTYRDRYPEVPAMWKAQEKAAVQAVLNPGTRVKCGVVTWVVRGRFLKCLLPSGRALNYADPFIKYTKTPWGEKSPSLRFFATNQKTKRWQRDGTYGGKLTENITQAIARDVLGEAKILIDDNGGYDLLLSVHDEIISEVDEGCGDEGELLSLMTTLIPAMAGCPINAEPVRYTRYRK